ncbi:hypothetical protein KSZ_16980 [Dictyobacter formicarum]|uniref:Uncharacterized protein n=1 Tax=Dictyobacter formicarum TaxID=2778368 RepID=A0ABQ3VCQ6_9CHLR|nr:hypothetical protein KSZ_16980 [Dictyobacter formicarum]
MDEVLVAVVWARFVMAFEKIAQDAIRATSRTPTIPSVIQSQVRFFLGAGG